MNRAKLVEYAKRGVEAEIAKLQEVLGELGSSRGSKRAVSVNHNTTPGPRRRRRMSAEARRAISERMKASWAARRGESSKRKKKT